MNHTERKRAKIAAANKRKMSAAKVLRLNMRRVRRK